MTRSTPRGGEAGPRSGPVGRLRASGDVRAVFAARRAAASAVAVVHARDRGNDAAPRLTVVAGKAVGNAVERNRVKRRLRAAVPAMDLRKGCDYVVVGRKAALDAPWAQLQAALASAAASVWTRR